MIAAAPAVDDGPTTAAVRAIDDVVYFEFTFGHGLIIHWSLNLLSRSEIVADFNRNGFVAFVVSSHPLGYCAWAVKQLGVTDAFAMVDRA